jgi:hypothetical protein
MGELNLRDMALELLLIDRNFTCYLKDPYHTRMEDFEFFTFEQTWGNTSGGFEGIGGCAMTNQRTYVFVPVYTEKEECLVFFGGRFAYHAPYCETFLEDVRNQRVAGVSKKSKYRK